MTVESVQRVIFVHIPKAAGSTLEGILVRRYPPGEIFALHPALPYQSLEELKGLPPQQRSRIRLVTGHMPYGAHEHFAQPSVYVSMIRHPVKRLISHYRFVLRRPAHYLYEAVTSRKMSLREYVQSGISTETDNGQVRLLAGHDRDIPYGDCNEALLEKAKQNILHHFVLVGISEDFDRSLVLMSRKLHWANVPVYRTANVAPPAAVEIPNGTIEAVEQCNPLDLALYDWVKARVQSEWRAESQQLDRIHRRFLVRKWLYQATTQRFRRVNGLARRTVRRMLVPTAGR